VHAESAEDAEKYSAAFQYLFILYHFLFSKQQNAENPEFYFSAFLRVEIKLVGAK
jgi:hypothetical protein